MLGFTTNAVNAQTISKRIVDTPRRVYIPCVPEWAIGTYTIHSIRHFNKDGSITMSLSQPQCGELIGQETGTVYRPAGAAISNVKDINSDGAWTRTDQNIYHIIGQGGIQFRVHELSHITVDANGEITVRFTNTTVVCE